MLLVFIICVAVAEWKVSIKSGEQDYVRARIFGVKLREIWLKKMVHKLLTKKENI